MTLAELQLPEGLDAPRFLREYWQKKPLLIRRGWPGFDDPLSPEELAGLACEEGVEARLVLQGAGSKPWQLRHGPFGEEDFAELPETHWSLLVHDAEKQLPELHAIIEPFRFIPDWRIDDLMISYAAPGGSVGPHSDDYDVFLLQGLGRKRWQIDTKPTAADKILPETELRILTDFTAEREWILEPGDILYLPPKIAHHGIALDSCLTYSIGFRAPGMRDLVGGFLAYLMDDLDPDARYADPDLSVQDNPGEITATALSKVRNCLLQQLSTDAGMIESWFGRFITEPKPGFEAVPAEKGLSAAQIETHLSSGGRLTRNPGSRFAYVDHGSGETALFVDGQEFVLGPEAAFLAPLLCRYRTLDAARLQSALTQPAAHALLVDLINEGYLIIESS